MGSAPDFTLFCNINSDQQAGRAYKQQVQQQRGQWGLQQLFPDLFLLHGCPEKNRKEVLEITAKKGPDDGQQEKQGHQ